jgi:4-amino-4-deoxychorismate lyase
MCLLFETIRIRNCVAENLEYHQERMDRSCKVLFGKLVQKRLTEIIKKEEVPGNSLFKCRIIYDNEIRKVEYLPYQPVVIKSLKIVNADDIIYHHKFFDRSAFKKMKKNNPDADELLLTRNGLITDTTFTNAAFYDGKSWFTPEEPLLAGTRRRRLIQEGRIIPAQILSKEIHCYQKVSLFNAMLDLENCVIETRNII